VTAKARRKMPVKLETFHLDGDYEGWTFTARTNPPIWVFDDLQTGEADAIYTALSEIIRDWNFVDEEGEPLGAPSPATIRKLPLDLILQIVDKCVNAVGSLNPKSNETSSQQPG